MQLCESQDHMRHRHERPAGFGASGRRILRVRHRLLAAVGTYSVFVCALAAIPAGPARSASLLPAGAGLQPSSIVATSPFSPGPAPAAVTNILREYRNSFGLLKTINSVSLRVVRWSDLARFVGISKKWAPPQTKLYVVLQTGSNDPAQDGVPRQPLFHWEIYVINPNNSEQIQILGLPGVVGVTNSRQEPRGSLRPSYWSLLPFPDYTLNLKTGKVIARNDPLFVERP